MIEVKSYRDLTG